MKKIILPLSIMLVCINAYASVSVSPPPGDSNINITETRVDRMPESLQQEYANQQTQKARDDRFNQLFSDPDDTKLEQDWSDKPQHKHKKKSHPKPTTEPTDQDSN